MKEEIEEKILNETTTFCDECPSKECCPEEECVLYRIEQIILNQKEENEENASNTKPFTCK